MMDDFPWIKLVIVSIPLIIIIWMMAPTMKWKILFAFCVPIGVGLALSGKNVHKRTGF